MQLEWGERMEEQNKSRAGAVIAIVTLVLVVVVAWFAYTAIAGNASRTDGAGSSTGQVSALGTAASTDGHWSNPSLEAVTIADVDGYPITLGTLCDGKVTVVNVWATWCPYCVDEMADYQTLYEKHGDSIQFVMLDSAESSREVSDANDYIKEQGFTFPVFYDTDLELQRYFSVSAYPTTIVIDANGEVLSNKPGRIMTSKFDETLTQLTSKG